MNPTDRTDGTEERVRRALGELFPEPTTADLLPRTTAVMRRRRRWRRSGIATAAVAALAAVVAAITLGVGSGGGNGSSHAGEDASCAPVVVFRGHTYLGDELHSAKRPDEVGLVPAGHLTPLGRANQPPCNDTGGRGTGGASSSRITVKRIVGVSPEAIVAGNDGTPYQRLRGDSPASGPTRQAAAAARRLARQHWIRWITP